MPFRRVQRLSLKGYVPVYETKEVQRDNGNIEFELENRAKVSLPDAELFDIKNQLKAGVDLEEVNSKVMSRKSVDGAAVVRKYTKKATVQSADKE